MNVQKTCALCFLALLLSLSLSACAREVAYTDELTCEELMDKTLEQIPVDFGYETYGGEQIRYHFDATELPDDLCLRNSVKSE